MSNGNHTNNSTFQQWSEQRYMSEVEMLRKENIELRQEIRRLKQKVLNYKELVGYYEQKELDDIC